MAPVIEIPEMARAEEPVLVSVTVCAALVEPVLAVKVKVEGESEAPGAVVPPSWLTVKVWQPAVMVMVRGAPVVFCATL